MKNIKEKVLKEIGKRVYEKFSENEIVDITLAEVSKVIDEEVITSKEIIISRSGKEDDLTELAITAIEEYSEELKTKLGIK